MTSVSFTWDISRVQSSAKSNEIENNQQISMDKSEENNNNNFDFAIINNELFIEIDDE